MVENPPHRVTIRQLTPDEIAQKNKLVNDTRAIILPENRTVPLHFEGWMKGIFTQVSVLPFALYEIGDLIGSDLPTHEAKKVLDIFRSHDPDRFSEFAEYVQIGQAKRERDLIAAASATPADRPASFPPIVVRPATAESVRAVLLVPPVPAVESSSPVENVIGVALTLDQVLTIRSSYIPIPAEIWKQIENIKANLDPKTVDRYLRAHPTLVLEIEYDSFPRVLQPVILNALMKINSQQVREYLQDDPTKVLTLRSGIGLPPAVEDIFKKTTQEITPEQVSQAIAKDPLFPLKVLSSNLISDEIQGIISVAKKQITDQQLVDYLRQSPKSLFDLDGVYGWIAELPGQTRNLVYKFKFEFDNASVPTLPEPHMPELDSKSGSKTLGKLFDLFYDHWSPEMYSLVDQENTIFKGSEMAAEFRPRLMQLRQLWAESRRLNSRYIYFEDPILLLQLTQVFVKEKVPEAVWDSFVDLRKAHNQNVMDYLIREQAEKLEEAINTAAGITSTDIEQKNASERQDEHMKYYWSYVLGDMVNYAHTTELALHDPALMEDLLWFIRGSIQSQLELRGLDNQLRKKQQDYLDQLLDQAGFKVKPGDKKYRAEIIDKNPLKRLKW